MIKRSGLMVKVASTYYGPYFAVGDKEIERGALVIGYDTYHIAIWVQFEVFDILQSSRLRRSYIP